METVTFRVRSLVWFVTGAMLATAVTLMFVNAWRAEAAPGDSDATLVPITPCRLVDTRQPGGTPLGAAEVRTIGAHGTNGPIPTSQCTIPTDAVALSMNVTAIGATAGTFWTIWPTGTPRPEASSLNPAPGQPPTPNAVTTPISTAGKFNVFNAAGTAGMLIDVNGYYTKASLQELANRLAAVEAAQATNTTNIATNTTDIATNTADIAAVDAREPFATTNTRADVADLVSTPTRYVSVTVTAPVAGHVTVDSTAWVNHGVDGGIIRCAIFEDTNIPTDNIPTDTPGFQLWKTGVLGNDGTLSGTRRFEIDAAATAAYTLACEEDPGGGFVWAGSLTAIFTPTP